MLNYDMLYKKVIDTCFTKSETSKSDIKQLRYQTDAVNQAVEIINKYDGVIVADVVGLGKTYVALMIVEKLMMTNKSALIVIPPSLDVAWSNSIDKFSSLNGKITVVSNAQLNKVKDNYDVIVVDESHNFRNNNTNRYKSLKKITTGKKVILLSATPLQNKLSDLYNQLMLFSSNLISKITNSNLEYYFKTIQNSINTTINDTSISSVDKDIKLKSIFSRLRNEILSKIMVRRTRKNLTSIPQYANDLQTQGIIFPQLNKPLTITYNYTFSDLLDSTLYAIENRLAFANYNVFKYLTPSAKIRIEAENKIKIENITNAIDSLFKTILLKRLDSSIHSFKCTLSNIHSKISQAIKSYNSNSIMIDSEIENVGIKSTLTKSDVINQFMIDMESDLQIIGNLQIEWDKQTSDNKIDSLKTLLTTLSDKKVVIFSESVDTINYIDSKLNMSNVLKVTSENRKSLTSLIATEFDANSETKTNDYSVLLTSNTLSEGVNLHRASVVINFDITWNPTRVIQRIGRIDRIGSTNATLDVYNFISNSIVNSKLYLTEITNSKIQLFNNLLGNDNPVLSENEGINTFDFFELDSTEYDNQIQLRNDINSLTQNDIENLKSVNFNVTVESQNLINKRNEIYNEYIAYCTENETQIKEALMKSLSINSTDDIICNTIKQMEYQLAIHSIKSVSLYKSDDSEIYIAIKHNLNKKSLISGKTLRSNSFEIKDVIFITPIEFVDLISNLTDLVVYKDTNVSVDSDVINKSIMTSIENYNYTTENKIAKMSSKYSNLIFFMSNIIRQMSYTKAVSQVILDDVSQLVKTMMLNLDSKLFKDVYDLLSDNEVSFIENVYHKISKDYTKVTQKLKSENITEIFTLSF
jgi:superfamily II DNA or RNA helicase